MDKSTLLECINKCKEELKFIAKEVDVLCACVNKCLNFETCDNISDLKVKQFCAVKSIGTVKGLLTVIGMNIREDINMPKAKSSITSFNLPDIDPDIRRMAYRGMAACEPKRKKVRQKRGKPAKRGWRRGGYFKVSR